MRDTWGQHWTQILQTFWWGNGTELWFTSTEHLRKIFAKKRQSIIRTAHKQITFYLKIIFWINICKSNYVLMVKDNLQWHIEIMHTCYKLQEINAWISYNLCNRIPVTPLLKQLHLESDILLKTIGAHWVWNQSLLLEPLVAQERLLWSLCYCRPIDKS